MNHFAPLTCILDNILDHIDVAVSNISDQRKFHPGKIVVVVYIYMAST